MKKLFSKKKFYASRKDPLVKAILSEGMLLAKGISNEPTEIFTQTMTHQKYLIPILSY